MPSPSPSQPSVIAPTSPYVNGISDTIEDESRQAATPNGVQDPKEKAKAVVAASTLEPSQEKARPKSPAPAESSSATRELANGASQARKRSRSGSPIIPPTSNRERTLKPRGPGDPNAKGLQKFELEQYRQRDEIHTVAKIFDAMENEALHDHIKAEAAMYKRLRGIEPEDERQNEKSYHRPNKERAQWVNPEVKPLRNPAAIYGPGYGQFGNFGNTTTQQRKSFIRYPKDRSRNGGRVTKELRVPRKDLATQAEQLDELVPIRLDIEWNKFRLRDTFTWNLHDRVVQPDLFARQLVEDFGLPPDQNEPLVQMVSASLQDQIQDFYPHVFIEEEALDPHLPYTAYKDDEMRIMIKLHITIGQHTLVDQFEWEINNPLNSPEAFARQMTRDLSLAGEFTTAIAHSIREQSQLFTRSLYVTGHPFDGRPIEDQELKAGFLPSPMQSSFRPYQAAKEFTPYLYELNEIELEKAELSLSREERRQKRSVNRRGGPALPDLKDRRGTVRTLVVSSVLPGAAISIEDSRIHKRTASSISKGRRPGLGHKDGLDDSDESDSEDSAPDSPAIPTHLLSGTARTRGMRGAATAAQAAMRGNLARSATPEASILHHHETRTSGRKFGGKDYREESVDDTPTSLIVKLRIPRERYRQFMRDQKSRARVTAPANLAPPAPIEHQSHRRSLSGTPGRSTSAAGAMGPPSTPGTNPQQPQYTKPQGSPRETREGPNPLHPHAAQLGRVDALGPPSTEHPMPAPPPWLGQALSKLQQTYPDDLFEGTMRYTAVSTLTDMPISLRPNEPQSPDTKFMYYPRIKCLDCPGKLYTPGPETGVTNFEVHLKNRLHREKVEKRKENGGNNLRS